MDLKRVGDRMEYCTVGFHLLMRERERRVDRCSNSLRGDAVIYQTHSDKGGGGGRVHYESSMPRVALIHVVRESALNCGQGIDR